MVVDATLYSLLSNDIHFLSQKRADLVKKISQIQQASVWSEFDQKINVTLFILCATRDSPKYGSRFPLRGISPLQGDCAWSTNLPFGPPAPHAAKRQSWRGR